MVESRWPDRSQETGQRAVIADRTHVLTGQNLGNRTLTPGVYRFDSSAGLTGTLTQHDAHLLTMEFACVEQEEIAAGAHERCLHVAHGLAHEAG